MHYVYRLDHDQRPTSSLFALVIYLPEDLDAIIAPLREMYDPDYNVMTSHITLVAPFETEKSLGEISDIVRRETVSLGSLKIELGSIGDYYPAYPIIYWQVKESEPLIHLYRNLHRKLGLELPFREFAPHVTVAKEISPHRLFIVKEKVVSYLPEESLTVAAVDLVSPVAGRQWLSVRTFPIATES
jgi:2'-5' RNA ligase